MNTAILWFKALVAAFVTGAATALTGSQGCDLLGRPLDWHQIGAIGLAGGFYGALAYLKQNPVPPDPAVLEIPIRSSIPKTNLTDIADK